MILIQIVNFCSPCSYDARVDYNLARDMEKGSLYNDIEVVELGQRVNMIQEFVSAITKCLLISPSWTDGSSIKHVACIFFKI